MNLTHFLSILIPLSLLLWLTTHVYSSRQFRELPTPCRWLLSMGIPLLFSYRGYYKNSLSISGAVFATFVGFILTISNYCFSASVLTFFVTSSLATKYKSNLKRLLEEDFKEGGQRNWVQVICNGGVATQMALFYLMEIGSREVPIDFINEYNASWFAISVLGSIACATGDTWASELGIALGGQPYLITSLSRVPKGTNGGVSVIGLLVSGLGGMTVSVPFYIFIYLLSNSDEYNSSPPQLIPIVMCGLFGGLFGSVVDSLLGATVQYSGFDSKTGKVVENSGKDVQHISGVGLLNNHSVNLVSTLITALVSPYFALRLWNQF